MGQSRELGVRFAPIRWGPANERGNTSREHLFPRGVPLPQSPLRGHPRSGILSTVRRITASGEKPLHWVGSSKRDLLGFPKPVQEDIGNALGIAQFGGTAPPAKPWKGLGSGVLEVVESHDGNACRAVYTIRFDKVVHVLHAFQKKSPSGTRTAT